MIDLGSNDIVSLYEFRNLSLPSLYQMSFASNRVCFIFRNYSKSNLCISVEKY
jgi:hypothetical protein